MNTTVIESEKRYYTAPEVAEFLGVSLTSAYRIIKQLNDNLKAEGFIVVPGKIGKSYFHKKVAM